MSVKIFKNVTKKLFAIIEPDKMYAWITEYSVDN